MAGTYRKEELYTSGKQRTYTSDCDQFAFLIGGIGTGNFSIGARGELKDWEIFGSAGKGNYLQNTFFALRVCGADEKPFFRVLEGQIRPPFNKPIGFRDHEFAGLPRFKDTRVTAKYPFVNVRFLDHRSPVKVALEAFNPFIPLDADNSGLPCGILKYTVKNTTSEDLEVSVAGSMANGALISGYHKHTWEDYDRKGLPKQSIFEKGGISGIFYETEGISPEDTRYASMALATPDKPVTIQKSWLNGGWWDGLQNFVNDFISDGELEADPHYKQKDAVNKVSNVGSVCVKKKLPAGKSVSFTFYITWSFPYAIDCWSERMYRELVAPKLGLSEDAPVPMRRQYYAKLGDAYNVAVYMQENKEYLIENSRKFSEALYGSTLPGYVIDAVGANITVLRSPTCFRLQDGTLMGFEGCFKDEGCCEGNCTHVWNYAQTVAYLFPELEMSTRRSNYLLETEENGKQNFRSYKWFEGYGAQQEVPAADGQMGTFIRFYREWRMSGDDAFLEELWPIAKKTLDFAFSYWDLDGDGVLETDQYNTYDISFKGISSMTTVLFLGALRAAEEICRYRGDEEEADRYRAVFERGSANLDHYLFNGEYYGQKIDDADAWRYQYGSGCLSDQLFGQTLAYLTGLGELLPKEHLKKAIKNVFDNNFITDFSEHINPQRTYCLNKEAGLLLCTWPHGGRPEFPFPYSDEVWTGIEYQVATQLVYEGYTDEALTLVKAVRDRHDGIRRNPFNEVECGYHYARSMASYGVYAALCGYSCDLPDKKISFEPKINADHFRCFFATAKGWGVYTQNKGENGDLHRSIKMLYGTLDGIEVR